LQILQEAHSTQGDKVMAESTEKVSIFTKIGDFFKGVKAEYSKISFPDKDELIKSTTAVIVISVIIAVLIFLIDLAIKYLLGLVL